MMNNIKIFFMPLVLSLAISAVSCQNDNLTETQTLEGSVVATLDEQAGRIDVSVKDIFSLRSCLGETLSGLDDSQEKAAESLAAADAELAALASGMEKHSAALSSYPWAKGTMLTIELSGVAGAVCGAVDAAIATAGLSRPVERRLMDKITDFEEGVLNWTGEYFGSVYSIAYAQAQVETMAGLLSGWKITCDAIFSDVQAGLTREVDADELDAIGLSVEENFTIASSVQTVLAELGSEVEEVYGAAVEASVTNPSNLDITLLEEINNNVRVALKSSSVELSDLMERVEECESQMDGILSRLEKVETDVDALLGMIQSVSFLSDFVEEKAVAYYELNTNAERTEEGYMQRYPKSGIEVSYLVRPAAAVTALADKNIWNNGLDIIGYYASSLTKASFDYVNFQVAEVTVDETQGVATLTLTHDLRNDFYFKKIGARLALSVSTGKNDIVSRFVEIVPKDAGSTVYVESLEISAETIEIDNGMVAELSATVKPDNATASGVSYSSSNPEVVSVTYDGKLTAKAVGDAVITVTTDGIDEWGMKLTKICNVKVNPSVKLMGLDYVEEGGETTITLQSPEYISPEYLSWEIGTASSKDNNGVPQGFNTNQAFASIDDNGTVKGLLMYYDTSDSVKDYVPLYVRCTIAGAVPTVLYHEIRVVTVQPLGISISNLSDTDSHRTTKVGQAIGLYGTIKPETVNGDYFKVAYLGANDGYFPASSVGTVTVTVSVEAGGSGKFNYFYPKGKKLTRNITVTVEPYYVQSITLPSEFEMNVDQTATLTPTFTSDIAGHNPTYQELKWESSDTTVVAIDETTGEMTSRKEGTVTITATTANAAAVPSGSEAKSAECVVTVKTPTDPIAIGDFYYSDGTWSTTRDINKNVIGIVFSKANAVASDPKLRAAHSSCTNGLVIALNEYTSELGTFKYDGIYSWLSSNGHVTPDTSKPNGYGSTEGLKAYRLANTSYMKMFDESYDDATDELYLTFTQANRPAAVPAIASTWYIPSYFEMKELYTNRSAVNASLAAVSGNQIGTGYYWSSTLRTYGSYNDCQGSPFDMSAGDWYAFPKNETEYPVRLILAF